MRKDKLSAQSTAFTVSTIDPLKGLRRKKESIILKQIRIQADKPAKFYQV